MQEKTVEQEEENTDTKSDVATPIARSWALADGEDTRVEDVTKTVELLPVSRPQPGNLQETDDQTLAYLEQDGETNTLSLEDIRRTVTSEHAGKSVSIFNVSDFKVLDENYLRRVSNGTVPSEQEVVVLTADEDELRGQVCRAVYVNSVTVASDGLGQTQTLTKTYFSEDECDAHWNELSQLEHEEITLTHEDEYTAVIENEVENTRLLNPLFWVAFSTVLSAVLALGVGLIFAAFTLLVGVLFFSLTKSFYGPEEESKVELGTPKESGLRREEVAECADDVIIDQSNEEDSEWVTVKLERGDDIRAHSTEDDRTWKFKTENGVLQNEEDVEFFKNTGFSEIESGTVTLLARPVTAAPDDPTWKLNETGNWWLCPTEDD